MLTLFSKALLALVVLFSAVYIPLQIPSIKSKIFPTPSPTPIVISGDRLINVIYKPSGVRGTVPANKYDSDIFELINPEDIKLIPPIPMTSNRALKAASTIYVSISKNEQTKLENRLLSTDSASLTVNRFAKEFDADPAYMAIAEAWIEKNLGGQVSTQNSVDYSQPQQVIQPNTNTESTLEKFQRESKQRCQEEINKYTLCVSEYSAKMGEYNSCLNRKLTNEWVFCSEPSNFCGFKPFCAY